MARKRDPLFSQPQSLTRRALTRRAFACRAITGATAAAFAGKTLLQTDHLFGQEPESTASRQVEEVSLAGKVFKSLKIGMVKVEGSLTDKFKAAREAGFEAIEMDSPGMNVAETLVAIRESGLPVDGTVCSTHWQDTHTNPDPEVREKALNDLCTAIRDTRAVGGSTVLLVVGHGRDGTPEEIRERAIENVSKALPVAGRHGVNIVVENVWNRFMYDHDGDATQTAAEYVSFIDDLNSPLVGMQFDVGNHWKYGSMGDWIRQLGRRIYKLDLKGFSRANDNETGNGWTRIGEGDVDWRDVRLALDEIGFHGWAAAEVGAGDLEHLKGVASRVDSVLGL